MDTTMTDTRPTFARLTSGKATNSWRAAIPAVVVVVALVALLAYLASSLSTSSAKVMAAQRDADEAHQQVNNMTKSVSQNQLDLSAARDPGRVTVLLAPADADAGAKASKKKAAAASDAPKAESTWAAVTWGEAAGGKTWMRVNAYGLVKLENGQSYHTWLTPASGNPVDLGALEADANGSAYAYARDLPALADAKSVALSLDESGQKQQGKVLAQADLPKLQSAVAAAQVQAPPTDAQAPATDALPQAKTGETTNAMHKDGNK
jgi:anti-sigma-K factor RskA